MVNIKWLTATVLVMLSTSLAAQIQTPAFQGAEGGGMYASGGRGGKVYYVNSLEDEKVGDKTTNEGTLRWCLDRDGAKTILFKVAGVIELKKVLNITSNTTIAGQSAPGMGICIKGNTVKISGDNIIVRFLRFRLGDQSDVEDDSFKGSGNKNVIIDHCSISWSTDECSSFYDNEAFTMQWCIISESLTESIHAKGRHGYGGIFGGVNASFHHNLLAHHDSRNPRMCGSRYTNAPERELVDFRNNVIYNWGSNSGYGGEGGNYNFINNYYKPTETSSNPKRIFSPNADSGDNNQEKGVWGSFYVHGNYVAGYPKVTQNNKLGVEPNPSTKSLDELLVDEPFSAPEVRTHAAEKAYELVLAHAGANLRRDATDRRIVEEVAGGEPPIKTTNPKTKRGLIDSQSDVGGWEEYCNCGVVIAADSNMDGIPDWWLECNYPGRKSTEIEENGYTILEIYLDELVDGAAIK